MSLNKNKKIKSKEIRNSGNKNDVDLDAFDVDAFLEEKGGASSGLKDLVLIKKLWPYIQAHQKELWLCLFLLLPVTASQIALPALVQRTIDGPIMHGELSGLALNCGLYLGLMGIHYLLKYYVMVLSQTTGQKIIYSLRTALYEHLQTLSPRFYNQTPIGKLVTRVTSDVENLSEMLSAGGLTILMDLAVIFGVILFMFFCHWQLTLITLGMVTIVSGILEFLRRKSRAGHDRIRVHTAAMNAYFQENFSGMDVIQLYQREDKNYTDFLSLNQSNLKTSLKTVLYDCSMAAWTEYLTIATLILILSIGGTAIAQGLMSFGLLIAFFLYVQMVFEPIEDLADKYTIIQSGLASIDKIMALFNERSDIISKEIDKKINNENKGASKIQELQKLNGTISFDHVHFGYLPNQPIINDLSFQIKAGENVAIIGPTGAGKTTLIKLLTRFYDVNSGEIRLGLNSTSETTLQNLPLETLRKNIITIQQDDFLFSRSIAENITLDYKIHEKLQNDSQIKEQLLAILKQVNAKTLYSKALQNPDFLLEPLKERGRNLSGGEQQLLLFARAVYHDPRILILDEATSAIDPQTEELIQSAMDKVMAGRTTLVIAHRLSTIQKADRILVISRGQVVQSGSHAELISQKDSLYARYHQGQQAGFI